MNEVKLLKRVLDATGSQLESREIRPEMLLREDLGLNSMALVELTMELEDELEVEVSDEDLAALKTVADVRALGRRLKGAGTA